MKADVFRRKLENSLRKHKDLATIVGVLRKVQILAGSDRTTNNEMAEVISSDSVLTAKVLQLVNSASFGLDRRISSVEDVIVILGYDHIRDICAGMMTAHTLATKSKIPGFDRFGLWRHSLGTASAASLLQKIFLQEESVDLYTAGLLCNIGLTIMEQRFEAEMMQIKQITLEKQIRMIEAERMVFGVTHAEVGFWVSELWHLDEVTAHAIRHHHGPVGSKTADLINLAYVLTQACRVGVPGEPMLAQLLPGLFKRLEINDLVLDRILRELSKVYDSLDPIFRAMAVPVAMGSAN